MPERNPRETVGYFTDIAAQRGFKVSERVDGGWVIHVPARKQHPANVQGDFKSERSAWLAAASLALETD